MERNCWLLVWFRVAKLCFNLSTLNKLKNMMKTSSWPCLLSSDLQFGIGYVDGKRIFQTSSNTLQMRMPVPVDEGPILYKKDGTKIRQNGTNHGTPVNRSETGLTGSG